MMPPYEDAVTSSQDWTISSWDEHSWTSSHACSLRRISFRILKSDWSIPNIGEVLSQPEIAWTNGIIWHATSPSVDVVLRISHIFIVVELVLIDLKYTLFESRSKWKSKSINKKNRWIVDSTFKNKTLRQTRLLYFSKSTSPSSVAIFKHHQRMEYIFLNSYVTLEIVSSTVILWVELIC